MGASLRQQQTRRTKFKLRPPLLGLALALVWALPSSSSGAHQTSAPNKWPSAQLARWGLVRGLLVSSPSDGSQVAAFLGLSYAGAPVGPLRFMPPPGANGGGELGAERANSASCQLNGARRRARALANFGPECVRLADWLGPGPRRRGQSEDCLNANVFVPMQQQQQKLEARAKAPTNEQQIKSSERRAPTNSSAPSAGAADDYQQVQLPAISQAAGQANGGKQPSRLIAGPPSPSYQRPAASERPNSGRPLERVAPFRRRASQVAARPHAGGPAGRRASLPPAASARQCMSPGAQFKSAPARRHANKCLHAQAAGPLSWRRSRPGRSSFAPPLRLQRRARLLRLAPKKAL